MTSENRHILITAIILLGIGCICCCLVTVGGWVTWVIFPEFSSPPTPILQNISTPQAVKPTATAQKGDIQVTDSELPPYVLAQMEIIEEEVIELRGLSPTGPVVRALLSPDQLQQHVIENFLADYSAEEAQQDALVLAAFGLLEPDFDLLGLYGELFSEQVAGFYDNETQEMYVVQEQAFEGMQRMTYAHEYTHVLQDQVYDFKNGLGYDEEACEADSERCAAIQALIEGDATLSELIWFQQYSTSEDKQQVMAFYNSYDSPVYDSAPAFLKEDFIFPYQNGLEFVQWLYDEGGWDAVDQAYRTLPASTEQILHPEKYPSEMPIAVTLPDLSATLGDSWVELDRGVMGEWYTYLILAHGLHPAGRIKAETAQAAAAGWGGDSYVVYYNEDTTQTVMMLHYVWDTPEDATEFLEAFRLYATARFDEPTSSLLARISWQDSSGIHHVHIQGQEISWIFAPQAAMAEAIWEALQP